MFFHKEVEMILPTKKQNNTNNKTVKIKSLNSYGAIGETIDEVNTLTVTQPVVTERTAPKVSIGL